MSWTLISAVSAYPANSISGISLTAGDLHNVDYSYSNTNQSPTCTDNASGGSNSYSEVGNVGNSGGSTTAHGHSFFAKAKATETVTATCTAETDGGIHSTVVRPGNGISATPEDGAVATTSESSSTANHTGGSVTPTAGASVYLHAFWFQETASVTLTENGASFTKESEETNHCSQVFDRIVASASGSYNDATTSTSTFYNSITQAYKENAGAAAAFIKLVGFLPGPGMKLAGNGGLAG